MHILTVWYFPYVDFRRHSEERGTAVTLENSMDSEILPLVASKLNFT